MKNRLRNISFPALLLLIVFVAEIKNIIYNIGNLFRGYFHVGSLLFFAEQICLLVLFYFLFMKEEQKKSVGIVAVLLGCATIINGLFSARNLFIYDEFIEVVVGGPLTDVISSVLIGLLLFVLGLKLIKNKTVTKKYYFFCGLSIFLVAYSCVFMAIANPLAILSKLPVILYVLSLWYIPKLYIDSEYQKTRMTLKKVTTVIFVVIAMYILLAVAGGLSGTSSGQKEPWEELGVPKSEYMQIYNYYKYGN